MSESSERVAEDDAAEIERIDQAMRELGGTERPTGVIRTDVRTPQGVLVRNTKLLDDWPVNVDGIQTELMRLAQSDGRGYREELWLTVHPNTASAEDPGTDLAGCWAARMPQDLEGGARFAMGAVQLRTGINDAERREGVALITPQPDYTQDTGGSFEVGHRIDYEGHGSYFTNADTFQGYPTGVMDEALAGLAEAIARNRPRPGMPGQATLVICLVPEGSPTRAAGEVPASIDEIRGLLVWYLELAETQNDTHRIAVRSGTSWNTNDALTARMMGAQLGAVGNMGVPSAEDRLRWAEAKGSA